MTTPAAVRIAHAYGNTRQGLRTALAAEIDVIETDVWYHAGDIYVRHDHRLNPLPLLVDRRMPGHPLPSLSVPLWRGYYIRLDLNSLRLREALQLTAGKRMLLLDTKCWPDVQDARLFATTLAHQIREAGATQWVAVCGQFWPVLDSLRKAAPELEVRYSMESARQWRRFLSRLEQGDVIHGVCMYHRLYTTERARILAERGIHVYCWTVDNQRRAQRLLERGAEGITSNDLSLLGALGDRP